MITLIVVNGGVTWASTRSALVESPRFSSGQLDFGIGPELAAKCAFCCRTLPTAIMHLDHILPRHGYQQKLLAPGTPIRILNPNYPNQVSTQYKGVVQAGHSVNIVRIGSQAPIAPADIMTKPLSGGVTKPKIHDHGLRQRKNPTVLEGGKVIKSDVIWECDVENLQWLCVCCNTSKGDRTFSQWSVRPPIPMTSYRGQQ
jgi:hypothetical protein